MLWLKDYRRTNISDGRNDQFKNSRKLVSPNRRKREIFEYRKKNNPICFLKRNAI
ncbi:hypothetical protein P689_122197 [Candidatus Riesia pediculischaeffi PTSU]|uniref:Uncharacterized protein n=1 Tax=Candidatus Riesia pediculischaeffi PTSU TaxID=1401651 RepID=A0A0C1V851_9ENTR|nr:hypothetical protein P689_122197 [Candidatus Riesia pediculischaeffi PTSU]